jgi:hypothetical protein
MALNTLKAVSRYVHVSVFTGIFSLGGIRRLSQKVRVALRGRSIDFKLLLKSMAHCGIPFVFNLVRNWMRNEKNGK